MIIDTPNSVGIESKTEWIRGTFVKITLADGGEAFADTAAIRGRGNVTWTRYPKKPYSLKLDRKASLLGMKSAKRWVLLANWADRTLLRNDVAFEMARRTSLLWTPQGKPVELILNGVYWGQYYLCEKIQIHKNRLDIVEMSEEDEDEESITGGYLMEIDSYFDEVNKFRSAVFQMPYQFRNPKEESLTKAQFSYMEEFVNNFEQSIADVSALLRGEYREWICPQSFVDRWIVNELCYNKEVRHPKSVYAFKQRGEPLRMGPVWDFDFGTFTPHDDIYVAKRFSYLSRLFLSPDFQKLAKRRWADLRPLLQDIPEYIEKQSTIIRHSAESNFRIWPISRHLNGDEDMKFDEAIERMK